MVYKVPSHNEIKKTDVMVDYKNVCYPLLYVYTADSIKVVSKQSEKVEYKLAWELRVYGRMQTTV